MEDRWAAQLTALSLVWLRCRWYPASHRGCWKGMFLSQTGNYLLLFTLGKQPFQLRSVMLGLDEGGQSSRKLCRADFVALFWRQRACLWSALQQEDVSSREQVWAASRHERKITNLINRQVFAFQCWLLCQPKSGKGFRQIDFLLLGGKKHNLKEPVFVNLGPICWLA